MGLHDDDETVKIVCSRKVVFVVLPIELTNRASFSVEQKTFSNTYVH